MKISVIMQSYLGEYPGSRTNPKEKFIRAVNSFLAQKHEDKELIIVADKCKLTVDIYNAFYKDISEIKCFYYEDESSGMMYKDFYRGVPRQFGIDKSEGEIIAYLDSDDVILPDHLLNASKVFKEINMSNSNVKWISNPLRFLNIKALTSDEFSQKRDTYLNLRNFYFFNYGIIDEFFLNLAVPNNMVFTATHAIFHKKNIPTKWLDVPKTEGMSEDLFFVKRLLDECGIHKTLMSPTYIVCHHKWIWDN